MKKFIPLILFLLLSAQLFCCSGAHQYRLFPLGTLNTKIICLKLTLERYDYHGPRDTTNKTPVKWKGQASICSINANTENNVLQVLRQVDFFNEEYVLNATELYTEALLEMNGNPNFVSTGNIKLDRCYGTESCKWLELITSDSNDIVVRANNINHQIEVPGYLLQNSPNGTLSDQHFEVFSVRKIEIGELSFLVVNFGSGEFHNSSFKSTKKNKCARLENGLFQETVVYHGLSMDSLIFLNN